MGKKSKRTTDRKEDLTMTETPLVTDADGVARVPAGTLVTGLGGQPVELLGDLHPALVPFYAPEADAERAALAALGQGGVTTFVPTTGRAWDGGRLEGVSLPQPLDTSTDPEGAANAVRHHAREQAAIVRRRNLLMLFVSDVAEFHEQRCELCGESHTSTAPREPAGLPVLVCCWPCWLAVLASLAERVDPTRLAVAAAWLDKAEPSDQLLEEPTLDVEPLPGELDEFRTALWAVRGWAARPPAADNQGDGKE